MDNSWFLVWRNLESVEFRDTFSQPEPRQEFRTWDQVQSGLIWRFTEGFRCSAAHQLKYRMDAVSSGRIIMGWGGGNWKIEGISGEAKRIQKGIKCPYVKHPLCCSVSVVSNSLQSHSMPGFPVLHYLLKLAQTHVHWVSDATQPSHPLLSPSPLDFNLSQHQGVSSWVGSSHQVAQVLELQIWHQSFQWKFRTDLL